MQQIGRYQVVGELGRGAMGIVYRAEDPAIGRTIAIKSIRLQDLTDEAERERVRERLFREAQSAGVLSHPGIVTIYDIAEDNGLAYIFMEFVNGAPLEKMLLTEQTPDGGTLLSIFRQTAAALDYAHKKGIIHRDIKPANIMIHEDGTAKVTDFGVAKIMSQQMTLAGTMMGTPSYMSPEQVQGINVDGRADQFSLAVIAYEVLTGEKPFAADYLPTLLYKIVREDPVAPQRLNPTLCEDIGTVLRHALSKNPDDRYENCMEFVAALSAACRACDGWVPMPRGASLNMPTVGSIDRLATAPELVVMAAPPLPHVHMSPARSVTEVQASVEPPPLPETPAFTPIPDPLTRPDPLPSNLVRNVMLVAGAVMALGVAGIIGLRRDRAASPPAAVTEPVSEQPVAQAVTPPEAGPPAEVRPPPPPPAPVEETAADPPPPKAVQSPPKKVDTTVTVPVTIRTPSESTVRTPAEGTFKLTTSPVGAKVIFDNDPGTECTAPCSVTLPAGRHSFVARHSGYRDSQRIIEIPRDTGMIMDLIAMTGILNLVSTPPGLTVFIDGKEQGRKTPLSLTLPVGEHRVQVVKGTDRQEFAVDIRDGALNSKSIEWTP